MKWSESKELSTGGNLLGNPHSVTLGNNDAKKFEELGDREIKLPVGDYSPSWLRLRYGDLSLRISENYHGDGKQRTFPPFRFAIKIREDKPFVFDLPNEPTVLFARPAKETTIKRGESIEVKPVLIDPVWGIMFREIYDLSQNKEITYKVDGKVHTGTKRKSLVPIIEITNSKGVPVDTCSSEYG